MYDQYYNFTGRPFQLTPDPKFYFESLTHRKAMSYLGYGLAQGEGFMIVTGDIGAGKTTLVGHLMATIDPQRLTAVKIVSAQPDGSDILHLTAQALGIPTEHVEKAHLFSRIEAFLHHQARAGKRTLLIVDEAQTLALEALGELWTLSNVQIGGQALLQIFLLGQTEFREKLAKLEGLEQIRERIIANHHLDPMHESEIEPYIEHQLKVVGWVGNPRFTPDACTMLGRASGGVPRRLNALVSRVLLLGAIDHLDIIDERVVEAIVADLGDAVARAGTDGDMAGEDVYGEPAPPQAEGDGPASSDIEDLQALRDEVQALNAAMSPGHDGLPDTTTALAAIEARLARVEARIDEQDDVLRRVLGRLIEWVEGSGDKGTLPNRAA